VQVAEIKVVRVEPIRVAIDQRVERTVVPGIAEGYGVEGLHGRFEPDRIPEILDHLRRLAVHHDVGVDHDLDLGAGRARLLE
jgi:hypothetical protein